MQRVAVRIIKEEHTAIAAVLYSLQHVVRRIGEGEAPNFRLLHAILDYIVEYPERWHHPKEDRFLFRILRERSADAAPIIDGLEAEHRSGAQLINDLTQTLVRYEQRGEKELPAFRDAVEAYADFHWKHMSKEEDVLLPLAEKALTESDWDTIAEAFRENDNPLFGLKPKEQSEALFQRILNLAPAPLGLAEKEPRPAT